MKSPNEDGYYIEMAQGLVADLYPVIIYGQPSIRLVPPGTIIGTWAWSKPNVIRFILRRDMEIVPGVLPSDLARTYIKDNWKLPIRRRKHQLERAYNLPLHARKGKYEDCVYIDISKAYLKVIQVAGYDVDYLHNSFLSCNPHKVHQDIQANKWAYSLMVSISSTKIAHLSMVSKKQELFTSNKFNIYSNPCLYNLASDLLASIVSEILRCVHEDCVYANTDGVIVKRKAVSLVERIITSWGYTFKHKGEGDCEIFGVASYKIGDKHTKRYDGMADNFTSKLPPHEDVKWLKSIWTKWHKRAILASVL